MSGPDVSEWLDFMADTVTINAFTGRDVAGKPTYAATTVTYRAYIEMKNRLIVGKDGRTITAKGRVFLGTANMIGTEDLLTLPAEYVPRIAPILAVNRSSDESGGHHTTLDIG